METSPICPRYDDKLIKLWAAAAAGLAICALGMREKLLVLIMEHTLAVLIVFLLTAMLAWLLIHYVSWQTRRLDRKWPWETAFARRLLHQIGWGVVLPAVIIILFALCFFNFLPRPVAIGDTQYFYSDFPLAVLMLMILNASYAFAYLLWYKGQLEEKNHNLQQALDQQKAQQADELARRESAYRKNIAKLKAENTNLKVQLADAEEASTLVYSLSDKAGLHAIPFTEIAFFHVSGSNDENDRHLRLIHLTLLDGRQYVAKEVSLLKIEETTGGFFAPVNRQYLVAQHAISACTKDTDGRLTLTVKPDGRQVKLSDRSSRKWLQWISEQVGTITLVD